MVYTTPFGCVQVRAKQSILLFFPVCWQEDAQKKVPGAVKFLPYMPSNMQWTDHEKEPLRMSRGMVIQRVYTLPYDSPSRVIDTATHEALCPVYS